MSDCTSAAFMTGRRESKEAGDSSRVSCADRPARTGHALQERSSRYHGLMTTVLKADQLLARGRRVLDTEIAAIAAVKERLQDAFVNACRVLHGCKGRVVVSGM